MNDTMIQEAVLDSIESINEQQLYAEFDVLASMAEVYMKADMIQEESTDLEFDGYVVQEADSEAAAADGDAKGIKKVGAAIKSGAGTALGWIKTALGAIGKAFGFIFGKIASIFKKKAPKNATKSDIQRWVENYEVHLDKVAQEAFNLPEKPTMKDFKVSDPKADYKAADSANRKYNKGEFTNSGSTVSVPFEHVTVYFKLDFNLKGLVQAFQLMDSAATYLYEIFEKPDNAQLVKDFKTTIDRAKKRYDQATRLAGTRTLEPYAACYEAHQEMLKYLKSAKDRTEEARKAVDGLVKYKNSKNAPSDMLEKHELAIEEKYIVTMRYAISEETILTRSMTKKAADFAQYMDGFLNTAQAKSKVSNAYDEIDADEKFGANAEFPG